MTVTTVPVPAQRREPGSVTTAFRWSAQALQLEEAAVRAAVNYTQIDALVEAGRIAEMRLAADLRFAAIPGVHAAVEYLIAECKHSATSKERVELFKALAKAA